MVKFMNSCSLASSNNDAFCNNLCILFITVAELCSKSGKGALAPRKRGSHQGSRKEGRTEFLRKITTNVSSTVIRKADKE